MRLSVSNIAWTYDERLGAYALLQRAGVTGLEIAPGIFFAGEADVFAPGAEAALRALHEITEAGLGLISMQALLFGVQGAALFGTADERAHFDKAMRRAIGFAGRFGIPNLIFGAPRQRIVPNGMTQVDAMGLALDQFGGLAKVAKAAGTVLSIEANPTAYGTNFLNTLGETLDFVERLADPAVKLVLDTGAVCMNQEVVDFSALLPRLGHVHLSEPHLAPAPAEEAPTAELLKKLAQAGYQGAVSIEMKRDEAGLLALESRLAVLMSAHAKASLSP